MFRRELGEIAAVRTELVPASYNNIPILIGRAMNHRSSWGKRHAKCGFRLAPANDVPVICGENGVVLNAEGDRSGW